MAAFLWAILVNTVAAEAPGPVQISPSSGTFTDGMHVVLKGGDPADVVYFTKDGTLPSATNGSVYEKPLRLTRTTSLRAVAVRGDETGSVNSAHYVHLSRDLANHRSRLPIMVIDTFDSGAIPGKGWNQLGVGIKQVPRMPAMWMLFDRMEADQPASLKSKPQLVSRIGIRQRGSFSSTWKEKPYSVEAWDERDDDLNVAPLGMPEDSDWTLYYPDPGSQKDRTLLYNAFMWTLSRKTGRYAPRFRWVEAFINENGGSLEPGDRRGIYAIVEKVKRGENRLPFEALSDDGKSGGWLLSINRMDPEPASGWPAPNGATRPQFFHTAGRDRRLDTPPNEFGRSDDFPQLHKAQFNFENPDGNRINTAQRAAIEGWFKEFEDVLYDDARWLDPENGYRKFIDAVDFVDFFILNNLAQNYDGLLLSVFPWRSSDDGRLRMGPTWDFNWHSYDRSGSISKSLMNQAQELWYGRLFQDPDFMQLYVERWQALRADRLSDASITEVITKLVEEFGEGNAVAQGIASVKQWKTRVEAMQSWLLARAGWLDRRQR